MWSMIAVLVDQPKWKQLAKRSSKISKDEKEKNSNVSKLTGLTNGWQESDAGSEEHDVPVASALEIEPLLDGLGCL